MIRFWVVSEPAPQVGTQPVGQLQADGPPPTLQPPEATPPPLMQPLQVQQMPQLPLPPGQILFQLDGVLLLIQLPVLLGIFAPVPPPQEDPQELSHHAAAGSSTSSARGAS